MPSLRLGFGTVAYLSTQLRSFAFYSECVKVACFFFLFSGALEILMDNSSVVGVTEGHAGLLPDKTITVFHLYLWPWVRDSHKHSSLPRQALRRPAFKLRFFCCFDNQMFTNSDR